jgi:ABC-type transporter Mla subunit MlaD
MARKNEQRTRFVVGIFVIVLSVLLFISLFIIGQSEGTWESKADVHSDFRTTSGLRKGSSVLLAGVEVGKVRSIDFVVREYACDPLTEDLGRHGAGRTDDCDEFLFCAPEGLCADLEEYAAKGMHSPCLSSEDCGVDEVCVTRDFRRRTSRSNWNGPDGVCARYHSSHRRVQVTMKIFENKLDLIRKDSRATIGSAGVLGDALVNVTAGMLEPVGAGGRIQSTPSLYEDIELFRERFEGLTEKVDTALSGISALFSELNDERTIGAVKGTLTNLEEITRQIAEGEGLIGALLNDPAFKEDVGLSLRKVREVAVGVETFVQRANGTLKKVDENVQPLIDDARKTAANISKLLEDLKDPANKSVAHKLLYDRDGKMVKDLENILADVEKVASNVEKITSKIDSGKGTIGKLVNESKPHDDLVKLLQNIERNKTLKALVRIGMEADDAVRDPASPKQ